MADDKGQIDSDEDLSSFSEGVPRVCDQANGTTGFPVNRGRRSDFDPSRIADDTGRSERTVRRSLARIGQLMEGSSIAT